MSIVLKTRHASWLSARVADGTFVSIEDALAQILEDRMASDQDDFAWLVESVDDARREVVDGRALSLDEHLARNAERLAKLS